MITHAINTSNQPAARASQSSVRQPKGSTFQLAMALCNAQRDDSASNFCATQSVPSRPGISSALALVGLALGHKPHAQRRPSLDQMGVPRLHLPMAPGICSALVLDGLALVVYVPRNFPSRGAITARRPRVPASVILARPHPSQQEASFLPCTRPQDFIDSRSSSTVFCATTSFF
jgi:hypothetical protein